MLMPMHRASKLCLSATGFTCPLLPFLMACTAVETPTNEAEQAVSMLVEPPESPKTCDSLPADTALETPPWYSGRLQRQTRHGLRSTAHCIQSYLHFGFKQRFIPGSLALSVQIISPRLHVISSQSFRCGSYLVLLGPFQTVLTMDLMSDANKTDLQVCSDCDGSRSRTALNKPKSKPKDYSTSNILTLSG